MTTQMITIRDLNSVPIYADLFSDTKYAGVLSENIPQSITVPNDANQYVAIFSIAPGADLWVACNSTAVVPTGTVSLTNSEQLKSTKLVNANDVISIVSPNDGATFGVVFYALK